MALLDPNTQLPTDALFQDRFGQAQALARRKRNRLGLIRLEVDGVDGLVDQPQLLGAIARRLEGLLRATDTISTLGPNGFRILLNDVDSRPAARAVAEELILAFAKTFEADVHSVQLGGRYGLAIFPDDAETLEDLERHAGQALAQEKAPSA